MTLTLVQGDAKVPLRGALSNDDTEQPLDITDCDVFFQLRKKDDNRYTVNAECDILDEDGGIVRYVTGVNDLNTPGDYLAQFEVRYPDGTIQTTKDWVEITIRRQ